MNPDFRWNSPEKINLGDLFVILVCICALALILSGAIR